jgi:hypothetical protein
MKNFEVLQCRNLRDGSVNGMIRRGNLDLKVRVWPDGGVDVMPDPYYPEYDEHKFKPDFNVPYAVKRFDELKESLGDESKAKLALALEMWDLEPKSVIMDELKENLIDRILRNRELSYYGRKMFKILLKYYMHGLDGQKQHFKKEQRENSLTAFFDFIFGCTARDVQKAVMVCGTEEDDLDFSSCMISTLTEVKVVCWDLFANPSDCFDNYPIEAIAYRNAIFDSFIKRTDVGADEILYKNDKYLMDDKAEYIFMFNTYSGEEGAEQFKEYLYKISDHLGVSRDKIYTKTEEGIVTFSDDTDCTQNVSAFMTDIPYDRGKTAKVTFSKIFVPQGCMYDVGLYVEIIYDYTCLNSEVTCRVTRKCYDNGLDISALKVVDRHVEQDSNCIFYSEEDLEQGLTEKEMLADENLVTLSLPGVLDHCKDRAKVVKIMKDYEAGIKG